MRVLAHDVFPNPLLLTLGVEYMPVDEMLPQCHVVSLHCPLLPSTRHIIDALAISKMRPGTMLINVSRSAAWHPARDMQLWTC
jgi:D-lactate dehydrogenase